MPRPRAKPPELLQGKGSRYAGTKSLQLIKLDPDIVPPAPRGLRKVARDEWEAFWRSRLASVVDMDADMDALRDWALLVSERDRLRALYRKQPLIAGRTGLVENPLGRVIERYSRRIDVYRNQFGMTPLSRMRLGIAIGEALDVLDGLNADDVTDDDEPELVDIGEGEVIEVATR